MIFINKWDARSQTPRISNVKMSNTMNYSHHKMNSKLSQSTINVYLYKIKNQSISCDRMSHKCVYAYSAWKIMNVTEVEFSMYYSMGQIIILVKNLFFMSFPLTSVQFSFMDSLFFRSWLWTCDDLELHYTCIHIKMHMKKIQ